MDTQIIAICPACGATELEEVIELGSIIGDKYRCLNCGKVFYA